MSDPAETDFSFATEGLRTGKYAAVMSPDRAREDDATRFEAAKFSLKKPYIPPLRPATHIAGVI